MRISNEFKAIGGAGLVLVALVGAAQLWALPGPLALIRVVLGLIFALLVPGYALQAALFPRALDMDTPERAALSFGLSAAVIPPIAVLLDKLPWGIRLWPIVVSLTLLVAVCSAVAWYRRRGLASKDRFRIETDTGPRGWWRGLDRGSRIAYSIIGVAMAVAVVSTLIILLVPKSAELFTEFYILGPQGLAQDYPTQAVAGQPVTVTMGITNREGVAAEYRVEVRDGEQLAGQAGPIRLESGATHEQPISFTLSEVGDNVAVDFYLYRDNGSQPYRTLKLWMKVTPAQAQAP